MGVASNCVDLCWTPGFNVQPWRLVPISRPVSEAPSVNQCASYGLGLCSFCFVVPLGLMIPLSGLQVNGVRLDGFPRSSLSHNVQQMLPSAEGCPWKGVLAISRDGKRGFDKGKMGGGKPQLIAMEVIPLSVGRCSPGVLMSRRTQCICLPTLQQTGPQSLPSTKQAYLAMPTKYRMEASGLCQ